MLAGAGEAGVVIPRSALLRTGGRTFVYVRRDATDFERREVPPGLSDTRQRTYWGARQLAPCHTQLWPSALPSTVAGHQGSSTGDGDGARFT